MGKFNFGSGLALLSSVFLAACGGGSSDSGSASCSSFSACGGDVVGTWTLGSFCSSETTVANPTTCPGSSIKVTSTTATGTVTFNADGTSSTNVQISANETADFPASCFTESQCTQIEDQLNATAGETGTCTYSTSTGCSCTGKIVTPSTSTGTYKVSGSSITLTDDGDTDPPPVDTFCVSGNKLSVRETDADGTTSTFTATK